MSTAVCLQAVLRDAVGPDLRADLAAAEADVAAGRSPLAAVPGVHFARWLIVPGDSTPADGPPIPATLVYTADVDGSWAAHLRELDRLAGPLLDRLFGHCVDYPTSPGDRARWLRERRVANAASYVNTVGLTVDRIGAEARLSDWLQDRLDQHRAELGSLRAGEIHRRLRADLAVDPAMAYALEPAAGESLTAQARRWLTLAAAVIIVLVLLPLLFVIGLPWVLALRRLERRDPSSLERPDRGRVDQLRSREDAFAHNPFAALGVVKAGSLRATTVKIVLLGISVAASCVFVRGSLAGVTTIHVARWVPLDGGRRMIFTSCYDGSLESYMNDFIDKLSWGLNVIFSNGVGYPRTRWLIFGGAKDEQTFKDYLRCHQLETSVSYAAHPSLTMANIRANAVIRRGLTTPLDDTRAAEWLALL